MRAGQTVPSNTRSEVDPFYLDLLIRGEKAFLAGDYREAASTLEVAVFGLNRRPDLILMAQVRLAVSWHRLQNLEKSRAAILKVSRLMEAPGAKTRADRHRDARRIEDGRRFPADQPALD